MEEYINKSNKEDDIQKDFELSHIIGLNTIIPKCVQTHPIMNECILYSVGGIVITEDLSEKNNQVFFRHGKNQVSCFKISNTGKFIAVGFMTTNLEKKLPTSIILWDYESKSIVYELTGIYKAITQLEFSPDDRFLAACGLDNSLNIWEVASGFKSFSRLFEFTISFIMWPLMYYENSSKNPTYTIAFSNVNSINYYYFFYELKSMQYNIKPGKFTLPSSGFVRNYTAGIHDKHQKILYLGTGGGELCIFLIDNLLYKSSFNVIKNGVTDMLLMDPSENALISEWSLIVGGGDGTIKRVVREGSVQNNTLNHSITHEIQLNGKIMSMGLTADKREIVCSTANGYIYRIIPEDLTYSLHSISHTSPVNDTCFNNRFNDKIFTVDDNGNVYLWDLNDFNLIGYILPTSQHDKVKSLCIGDDGKII